MKLFFKIISLAVTTVILMTFAAGCKKKPRPLRPPEQAYNEGVSFMGKHKGGVFNPPDYEKAREAFQEVLYDHPTSRYAPIAELRVADTFYEAGDYIGATEQYEIWWRHHLGRPELPYVIYRTAISYYHLMLSKDRDQTYARMALANFRYLISNYPDNEYAAAVGEKVNILEVRLAHHEMYVGKFYFRHNRWWSAVDRFQVVLDGYTRKGFDEEALYYMWRSYRNLERFEEANGVYHKMVEIFPNGRWTRRAKVLETEEKRKGAEQWLNP